NFPASFSIPSMAYANWQMRVLSAQSHLVSSIIRISLVSRLFKLKMWAIIVGFLIPLPVLKLIPVLPFPVTAPLVKDQCWEWFRARSGKKNYFLPLSNHFKKSFSLLAEALLLS